MLGQTIEFMNFCRFVLMRVAMIAADGISKLEDKDRREVILTLIMDAWSSEPRDMPQIIMAKDESEALMKMEASGTNMDTHHLFGEPPRKTPKHTIH